MTQSQKINLYCILEDIQEQLLIELTPNLRHSMKHWAKKNIDTSRRFIREIDSLIKNNEGFGDDADRLRKVIEKEVKTK